ncbi:MAG TPA: hypothetical protein PKO09_12785 [Anaerolineae bacterium]|nr:hypothetical protein [Anaerolineae bacterium]
MVTQSDFTSEEWLQIMTAPQMASMYVTLASPSGPVGIVAETMAASKLVVQAIKETSGNALIDAVAAEYRERAENRQKLDMPQLSRNADELKAQCLQACRDLAALLSEKAPTEADGFVQWVYRAAQSTAEAAKEGGFLGIGGKKVGEAEVAAPEEISAALGISA